MILQVDAVEEPFEVLGHQLGELLNEMRRRSYYRFSSSVGWQPAVNVYEDAGHYYLCAELAGLTKDQIRVDVLGNKLLIKGDRPAPPPPSPETPGCVLRMEIDYGPFERAVELPATADMNSISARLRNGFLWITIEKRAD